LSGARLLKKIGVSGVRYTFTYLDRNMITMEKDEFGFDKALEELKKDPEERIKHDYLAYHTSAY